MHSTKQKSSLWWEFEPDVWIELNSELVSCLHLKVPVDLHGFIPDCGAHWDISELSGGFNIRWKYFVHNGYFQDLIYQMTAVSVCEPFITLKYQSWYVYVIWLLQSAWAIVQENIKRCVCIIYDPLRSSQGVLALKALKLTDSFMDLYRNQNFTGEK